MSQPPLRAPESAQSENHDIGARTASIRFQVEYGHKVRRDVVGAIISDAATTLGGIRFREENAWKLTEFDADGQRGTLHIARNRLMLMVAALACTNTLHGSPLRIVVLSTSTGS